MPDETPIIDPDLIGVAGNAATLKGWEESEDGKAWIAQANGDEPDKDSDKDEPAEEDADKDADKTPEKAPESPADGSTPADPAEDATKGKKGRSQPSDSK